MAKTKVLIMGAAGRDFHNFNTFYRDNPDYEVVAFTATQIPGIEGKLYPAALAGTLYPNGIPIEAEADLKELIKKHKVDQVVLAYSDLPFPYVMEKSSLVNACGADFVLMGPNRTMIKSTKPVIAVVAIRTGCGKSQTTRRVLDILRNHGKKVISIRHPMPYGDLVKQKVQRFADYSDLDKHDCTIEEREEYEPHIDRKSVIYAGVDYEAIVREAEKENPDVILWDGGNNDFPFYKPDLWITVVDPHRPGHEYSYYPGAVNTLAGDVIIINKEETANPEDIQKVRSQVQSLNPNATVIDGASPIFVENYQQIKGKKVLVVEDGPTLTHGGMKYGAGFVAAQKFGAAEIIDPRPFSKGSIVSTYKKYDHLDKILPAMGYGAKQMKELEDSINAAPVDLVIIGTPIDLTRVIKINKPALRVQYELQEIGKPDLEDILKGFMKKHNI
ncbi:MAG TPA: cyclic 2,3-diphosphoglycerate synthase [Thermotogota bacterium]|nr:GTPase [Thermotogota bacterium]HNR63546.1 cyclic 2,3-diphosphoglycerate synthase [Thermotogota bacterium]HNT95669.1 cyclic 2,3-diphosphoglycerate synthase [Thermotogota bacterium]HOZ11659.1 cyclic 2,3-diphosphoglycerate synthase [Thermotogota bacterium]HPB86463.1 cyclic 2,3-diphosphoglycerate synthase [Thermotogota bacterium]